MDELFYRDNDQITQLRTNLGVIVGDETGRRRRNLLLKVTVLSCLVKLFRAKQLCEINGSRAKTVFTKAPLSLTSAQGHLFCCKTKTTKYPQVQLCLITKQVNNSVPILLLGHN